MLFIVAPVALNEEIEVLKGRDSSSVSCMLDNSSPMFSIIALRSYPNSALDRIRNKLKIRIDLSFICKERFLILI